ncbi:MAG: hypothetical protein AABZ60_10465 [Planctomycetota bacterium]
MFKVLVSGLLLWVLILPISAQEENPENPEIQENTEGTWELPKNWSIKNEVLTLENTLRNYDPLIQSLGDANKDLKVDLERYLQDPQNQVLASEITLKLSHYANRIVYDFDRIIGTQDTLMYVFTDLVRKLGQFDGYLEYNKARYSLKVKEVKKDEIEVHNQLGDLARKVKYMEEGPEKQQLTHSFQQMLRRYQLKERYRKGYERQEREYTNLASNLKKLLKIFNNLHDSFAMLVKNLEQEKEFLLDNINLQADSLKIKKIMMEGINTGNRSIKNISQKLAQLYNQVDAFTQVNERVNKSLANFADSQETLLEVTEEIEKVGMMKAAPSIEKAIDYFASKSPMDPDQELSDENTSIFGEQEPPKEPVDDNNQK